MHLGEYAACDGVELAELVASQQVSADEVLESALAAVELVNAEVDAVVDLFPELVRGRHTQGPLAGVPVLLKDLRVKMAQTRTTHGSRLWIDDEPATEDDEIVRRFQAAGLVPFGKTNSPELGFNITTEPAVFGPTRNPWDVTRSAGGSSGGAAAAVATGMVPIAHASDGGGSIRIPSSCCGVFGLKPSRGRTPCGPGTGDVWNGLSLEHVITRSVRDSARILDLISAPAPGDPYAARDWGVSMESIVSQPERGALTIAFSTRASSGVDVDPDCRAAVERTVEQLQSAGHRIVERDVAFPAEELAWAFRVVSGAHAMVDVQDRCRALGIEPPGALEAGVRLRVAHGLDNTAADYARALGSMQRIGRAVGEVFEGFDAHVTPTVAKVPQPLGHFDANGTDMAEFQARVWEYIPFTAIYNVTGQPAMSVPVHASSEGLPVGVQIAAKLGREDILFALAAQLEQSDLWVRRQPPVHAGSGRRVG